MQSKPISIGALAKRANVSTSLLRYYEKEQLLKPTGRTDAGYRLYGPEAEQTLRFIRRAQRYGFSLHDIRMILGTGDRAVETDVDIMVIAEQRFLELERRLTEMLVLRHELEMFLDDIADYVDRAAGQSMGRHYKELVEQVCGHEVTPKQKSSLRKLVQRLGCNLAAAEWENVFADLRGQHVHIWREEDDYSIRFSSQEPNIRRALERLAAAEADCDAHLEPEVKTSDGGYLFRARGPNAFLFAQLFMALEAAEA